MILCGNVYDCVVLDKMLVEIKVKVVVWNVEVVKG